MNLVFKGFEDFGVLRIWGFLVFLWFGYIEDLRICELCCFEDYRMFADLRIIRVEDLGVWKIWGFLVFWGFYYFEDLGIYELCRFEV